MTDAGGAANSPLPAAQTVGGDDELAAELEMEDMGKNFNTGTCFLYKNICEKSE